MKTIDVESLVGNFVARSKRFERITGHTNWNPCVDPLCESII